MSGKSDIIIIGGGLIGPALALALAAPGFRVTVLDRVAATRRAEPDFDGRAYAVALGSMQLLQMLGVWGGVEGKAQPIRDIHVAEGMPEGLPLLHFDPRELDEGRVGWIVEDRWLRGALLAAMEAAGITQLAPVEVAGVDYDSAGATVRLADGETLTAPLVVACDGRRSAIAEAAGIRRLRWGYAQTGLVNAIEHEAPHEGLAHQSFFPGGPFAVLPLPPGNRSSNRSSPLHASCARDVVHSLGVHDRSERSPEPFANGRTARVRVCPGPRTAGHLPGH